MIYVNVESEIMNTREKYFNFIVRSSESQRNEISLGNFRRPRVFRNPWELQRLRVLSPFLLYTILPDLSKANVCSHFVTTYEDCRLGLGMHGCNTPEVKGNALEVVRFSKKFGIKII